MELAYKLKGQPVTFVVYLNICPCKYLNVRFKGVHLPEYYFNCSVITCLFSNI